MAKYINADALIADLQDRYKSYSWDYELEKKLELAYWIVRIANLDAADVRPNVRGEWVKDELGTTVCSHCKNPRRDNRINHIAYCNSCGADMRGEE